MAPIILNLKVDVVLGGVHLAYRLPLWAGRDATDATASTDADVQELREILERDGETLTRLRVGGETSDDVFLKRWLTAKRQNLNEAALAVRRHARWRAAFLPAGRVYDREIPGEIRAQKVFLQGCNRQGYALLVVLARRHDMQIREFQQTEKLIVYTLDTASALAELGGGKRICCLFDLSGLTLRNLDIKVLTAIFEILQKHYPERLGMIWMINAPFIFSAAWRVVSPLLEDCSRQKIKFVSCHEHRCSSFLEDSVSKDVLPRCYGGRASMIPIEAASYQIFHQGIQNPNELKPPDGSLHLSEEAETWREWLKRHKKLTKVVNWTAASCKAMVHNRFNRYLWTKIKRAVWRPKESLEIHVPPLPMKRPYTLTAYESSDQPSLRLVSWILWLVLIDIALILVGKLRERLFEAIWPPEPC